MFNCCFLSSGLEKIKIRCRIDVSKTTFRKRENRKNKCKRLGKEEERFHLVLVVDEMKNICAKNRKQLNLNEDKKIETIYRESPLNLRCDLNDEKISRNNNNNKNKND